MHYIQYVFRSFSSILCALLTTCIQTIPPYVHEVTMFFDTHTERPTDDNYPITDKCLHALHQGSSIVITTTTLWKYILMRAYRYEAMQQSYSTMKQWMKELPEDIQIDTHSGTQLAYRNIANFDNNNNPDTSILQDIPNYIKIDAHCARLFNKLPAMDVYVFNEIMVCIPDAYKSRTIQQITHPRYQEYAAWIPYILDIPSEKETITKHIEEDPETPYVQALQPHNTLHIQDYIFGMKLHNATLLKPETYRNLHTFCDTHTFTDIQDMNIPWNDIFITHKDFTYNGISLDETTMTHNNSQSIPQHPIPYLPQFDIILDGHGKKNYAHYEQMGTRLSEQYQQRHLPHTSQDDDYNDLCTAWYEEASTMYSYNEESHGAICGLTHDHMYRFLQFCNNAINTRSVWCISCYIGGDHIKTLLDSQQRPYDLHIASQYDAFPRIPYLGIAAPGDYTYMVPVTHNMNYSPWDNIEYSSFFRMLNLFLEAKKYSDLLAQFDLSAKKLIAKYYSTQPVILRRKNTQQFYAPYARACQKPQMVSTALATPHKAFNNIIAAHSFYPHIKIGDQKASITSHVRFTPSLPGEAAYRIDLLQLPCNWNSPIKLADILHIFTGEDTTAFPKYIFIPRVYHAPDHGQAGDVFHNVLIGTCDSLYFLRKSHKPTIGIYAETPNTNDRYIGTQNEGENHLQLAPVNRNFPEHAVTEDAIYNLQNDILNIHNEPQNCHTMSHGLQRLHHDIQTYNAFACAARNIPYHAAARNHPHYAVYRAT